MGRSWTCGIAVIATSGVIRLVISLKYIFLKFLYFRIFTII